MPSTPFLLFSFTLPFIVPLIILFILIVIILFTNTLKLPNKILIIATIISLVTLFAMMSALRFFESGFDDGPFYTIEYSGELPTFSPTDSISYSNGALLSYNFKNQNSPILMYRTDNEIKWVIELNPSIKKGFEGTKIDSITSLRILHGPFRDILFFNAIWTFGREQGYAYLIKGGQLIRYYLSW